MKKIKLMNKKYALVDDEDFDFLNQFRWYAHRDNRRNGVMDYVDRNWRRGGKSFHERMHRVIMKAPKGILIDHIDMNPLNNQKSNLRRATQSQNMMNRGAQKNSSSLFKGVFWSLWASKWRAQIVSNKKSIHLGYFNSKKEAALAYNKAADEYFGEFAKLNVI